MKIFLPLMVAWATLPAHAQIYKWTDANGHVQYSDHPQAGVDAKVLEVPHEQAAATPSKDDWRERDRISRENRARQAETERRTAAAQEAARSMQKPFNPSANRSNIAMSAEEACQRDRQQIQFAEATPHLTITHGHGAPQDLTEAQRQDVISERKANYGQTCGGGGRR
jgi:hypothetical protein